MSIGREIMAQTETTKPAKKTAEREPTISLSQVREGFMQARKNLRKLQSRQRAILNLFQESVQVEQALKTIGDKKEYESVIPLGAGVFVKGKINAGQLMRNLPGNIVLPSNQAEIETDLAERKKIFEKEIEILNKQIQDTTIYMQNMQTLGKAFRDATKAKKR